MLKRFFEYCCPCLFKSDDISPKIYTHPVSKVSVPIALDPLTSRHWVCTLFDFDGVTTRDLPIREGDLLIAPGNTASVWEMAINPWTGQQGYVPISYITDQIGKSPVFDAWYPIGRSDAVNLITQPGVESGTFMLRPSSDFRNLVLTVASDQPQNVFHYEIHTDESRRYYIKSGCTFLRLVELINYYSSNDDLLCSKLIRPYGKAPGSISEIPPSPSSPDIVASFPDAMKTDPGITIDSNSLLGRGAFGEVYCGSFNGSKVAVKRLLALTSTNADILEYLAALTDFKSPNLVTVLAIDVGPDIRMAMELMDSGSLTSYLESPGAKAADSKALLSIVIEVAKGMEYLEKISITHTDLRTSNVLLNSKGEIKLSDVGFRLLISLSNEFTPQLFPFEYWMAPEMAHSPTAFSTAADIWSFGILTFEVMTRDSKPFPDIAIDALPSYLLNGNRPPDPNELGFLCEEGVYSLMEACWQIQPSSRPSFQRILKYLVEGDHTYYNLTFV